MFLVSLNPLSVPSPVYKLLRSEGFPEEGNPFSLPPPTHLSHLHVLRALICTRGQGGSRHPDEHSQVSATRSSLGSRQCSRDPVVGKRSKWVCGCRSMDLAPCPVNTHGI